MNELAKAFGKLAAVPRADSLGFLPPAAQALSYSEQRLARRIMRNYATLPTVDEIRRSTRLSRAVVERVWTALGGHVKVVREPKAVSGLTPSERGRFNQAMRAYPSLPAFDELKRYLRITIESTRRIHRALRAARMAQRASQAQEQPS